MKQIGHYLYTRIYTRKLVDLVIWIYVVALKKSRYREWNIKPI